MPLKLAGLLVTSGRASPDAVDDALRRHVLAGGTLDTALLELGVLNEAECLRALADASGLKGVSAEALRGADPELVELVPARVAERHGLVPLKAEGRELLVAIPYPPNLDALDDIGFMLGREILPLVGLDVRLREAIARLYERPLADRHQALLSKLSARPKSLTPPPPPRTAKPPLKPVAPPKPAPAEEQEDALAATLARVIETAEPEAWALNEPALTDAERLTRLQDEAQAAKEHPAPGGREEVVAQRPAARPHPAWKFEVAREALEKAPDRDAIIDVSLRYARQLFDYAAAFAVLGGNAVGWAALGADPQLSANVERVRLPLDAPSVLRTVVVSRGRYLGPVPQDALSQKLIADLGRPEPKAAFLYPVEVRDRPVAILYGDVVGRPVSARRLSEFVMFAQHLGRRLERLILENKRRLAAGAPQGTPALFGAASTGADLRAFAAGSLHDEAVAFERAQEGVQLSAPTSGPSTAFELFQRSPVRRAGLGGLGGLVFAAGDDDVELGAPMPAPGASRLPSPSRNEPVQRFKLPAMTELFSAADRLVSNDVRERQAALAELTQYPEVAAAVLVARFPGPLLRARLPVTELPSADELGPVPAALVRMGTPAALSLVPLVDHRDVDTRYFALLTAGSLPSAELLQPVAQKVFDRTAVVANAARVALAAMRGVDGYEDVLSKLRKSLFTPELAAMAARALGTLHDVAEVEALIQLTGHSDRTLSQAAVDALREITKQSFGFQPGRWKSWWDENRGRTRAEWLVAALSHRDLELRLSAIDELVRAVDDNYGYYADGPRPEREEAIARWEQWLREGGRDARI